MEERNDYMYIPMAFPVAHATKFAATTIDFFVWPATLRDIIERARVCADQKESVM